jgi:hypothetical protein
MKLEHALIGLAAAGGIAFISGPASAQPPMSRGHLSNVDDVGYVCSAYGFHGRRHCYRSPSAYGTWQRGYPEDESYRSPAEQAAEEGGR